MWHVVPEQEAEMCELRDPEVDVKRYSLSWLDLSQEPGRKFPLMPRKILA